MKAIDFMCTVPYHHSANECVDKGMNVSKPSYRLLILLAMCVNFKRVVLFKLTKKDEKS